MQTQEAPVRESTPERTEPKRHNLRPSLIVAVLVVGVVAVGLAIWSLVGSGEDASDPQLDRVTELVDTMHDGLNETDVEKAASAFTEDGVWLWEGNRVPVTEGFNDWRIRIESAPYERVSDVTALSNYDYSFVQELGTNTRAVVVVQLDGELLSQAEWVSDFYEAPTD